MFLLGVIAPVLCQEAVSQPEEANDFFHVVARAENFVEEGNFIKAISVYREFLDRIHPRLSSFPNPSASFSEADGRIHGHYEAISYLHIAGIYRDYLGDYEEAAKNYERVLSLAGEDNPTYLSKKAARRWLERIRLDFLREALNRYYVSEVEYPLSLKELSQKGYIDEDYLADSFGKSYIYEPEPSELFRKLEKQEYILYCESLGKEVKPLSVLINDKRALREQFSLEGLIGSTEGKAAIIHYRKKGAVSFSHTDKPVTRMLREEEKIGGAQVLEITDAGVILYVEDDILVLTSGQ